MKSLLKPDDVNLLADLDLSHNYRALQLALEYKTEITVELALIASGLRGTFATKQPPSVNYRRHNFTRSDAREMAELRGEGKSYPDIGDKFGCAPSHVYYTLKKYGLLEG